MTVSREELAQRMDRFRDGLRTAGVKVTHQRAEICRELAKSTDHPDAERICRGVRKRVPAVSLDTVYRTLWLLLHLGLGSALGARDRVRFDGNAKPHHHFICQRCGTTSDFYDDGFDQLGVPASASALGRIERMQVVLRGVCPRCLREGAKRAPRRAAPDHT
jgi:Fur family transcriptional regulator, peroxide stress response regulator